MPSSSSSAPPPRLFSIYSLVLCTGLAGVWASVVACSSDSSTTPAPTTDSGTSSGSSGEEDGGSSGGEEDVKPAGPMTLTSTAYKEGDIFPKQYTCDGTETNSPALSWTPGPEGTLSYAIVFNDKTLDFRHSAIYDIPADVLALPENVEPKYQPKTPAGAKQALNYKAKPGFIGPCPPSGEHIYEFTLYALKVESLANLSASSEADDVLAAATKQSLKSVKLSAKYTQEKNK